MVLGAFLAAALAAVSVARAADTPETPKKPPNWSALEGLLVAGDYAQAAAAADEIVTEVTPKRRAPDFLARSIEEVRALVRRGLAELRLGRLDAADKTFMAVQRIFKDGEVGRLVGIEARQGGAAVKQRLKELEFWWIELQHLRMTVLCERLRLAASDREAVERGTPEERARLRDEVAEWLDQMETLKRAVDKACDEFLERRNDAEAFLGTSPYRRSLVGRFRTELVAGITSLELSRLPGDIAPAGGGRASVPAAGASPQGGREELLSEAIRRFDAAMAAVGEAVAASGPTGGGLRPEGKTEAALMEAEVLANRASALRDVGDLAGARKDIGRVVELLREVNVQRRRPDPDVHADLFAPLLLSAELAVAEAQGRLRGGDIDAARAEATRAETILERLATLGVPDDHPAQRERERLQESIRRQMKAVEEAVPRSDAADAAARRLREGLDAASDSL